MKIYTGSRNRASGVLTVLVDGEPLLHRIRHSPTGFEWGYGGSGPADLALSILWDLLDGDVADRYYQCFKHDMIARLPGLQWILKEQEIRLWLKEKEATDRAVRL
jgi:hypothetical protein